MYANKTKRLHKRDQIFPLDVYDTNYILLYTFISFKTCQIISPLTILNRSFINSTIYNTR